MSTGNALFFKVSLKEIVSMDDFFQGRRLATMINEEIRSYSGCEYR